MSSIIAAITNIISGPLNVVVEYALTKHRSIFAVVFLLPLSVLFEVFYHIRNKIVFAMSSAPKEHDKRVREVQAQVRQWQADGENQKMCTARPGWLTISLRVGKYKETMRNIKVELRDVLEVDQVKKTVRVEPLVSMGQLTATLLPLGLTIPVVPELDDLTVGGLINGFGIESSSHKYGLFQHICTEFELVMADGSVETCSRTKNPDLFYAVPWSYGTLGFLVSATLNIIEAKKYVMLKYEPLFKKSDCVRRFDEESRNHDNEFVEELMYDKNSAVLMTGKLVDTVPAGVTLNAIGRWYKPWFFKHVEEYLTRKTTGVECIPLRDYYHRHTRSIFWELQDIIPFGNNLFFRLLAGWMVPPKISLLKLTETKATKKLYELHHVVQDMLVPMKSLEAGLDCFDKEFNLYPLWICPMTIKRAGSERNPMIRPLDEDELFVDLGAYGNPQAKNFKATDTLRRVEHFVRQVKGFQALYADCYMTREEFYQMFDHRLYEQMRKKYNCEKAFPVVYDKISKAARI